MGNPQKSTMSRRKGRNTRIMMKFRYSLYKKKVRKHGGVQKSMGNKAPWKTGMLIYDPVTLRPLIFLQKEAFLSPCNFANRPFGSLHSFFFLSLTSAPMKWRTPSQRPKEAQMSTTTWLGVQPSAFFGVAQTMFLVNRGPLSPAQNGAF